MSEDIQVPEPSPALVSQPFGVIASALQSGSVVPFLGAAASAVYRPSGTDKWRVGAEFPPFGSELAEHLASEGGFPDPANKHSLPLVASYYAHVTGDQDLLNERLRRVFNLPFKHGKLHQVLARNHNLNLIVTTNYDDLMEKALLEQGRPYKVVVDTGERTAVLVGSNDDGLKPAKTTDLTRLLDPGIMVVYKLHGCLDRRDARNDHFLITEQNYVDFLGRGSPFIPAHLHQRMQNKRFLFLGYSLVDWNVRVLLRKLRNPGLAGSSDDRRSWAITMGPGLADREIWDKHGVRMIHYDILRFAEEIEQLSPDLAGGVRAAPDSRRH